MICHELYVYIEVSCYTVQYTIQLKTFLTKTPWHTCSIEHHPPTSTAKYTFTVSTPVISSSALIDPAGMYLVLVHT